MKILVLYTRLTTYWMSCMRYDHNQHGNTYLVVRKNPSKEAPFQLKSENGIRILDGDELTQESLFEVYNNYAPDLIYVAGWTDQRYLEVAKNFKASGGKVIVGMDNHWKGTLKQRIAGWAALWKIHRYFTHIWIPGLPQEKFAKKLGFKAEKILKGLYCADINEFSTISQTEYKKQLTFVGRLVEHKGLLNLFQILEELLAKEQLDIEVKIIGNGPLRAEIPDNPRINHIPFIEPDKLPFALENAGYFILPSLYEAWGVVVQEAALAGLPIITTRQTGAATAFVNEGKNGFVFDADNPEELKQIILGLNDIDEEKYFIMSAASKASAHRIDHQSWANQINNLN